ncbi:MAG: hypothetical protein H3C31_10395 [Brumimicrobium sp.]|nr:hypothetical protein [Brumimicrobium sp.]
MSNQNLILNMVTFNHPVEVKQFGLFRDEFNGSQRLHKSLWPFELQESNPELWDEEELEFLYTDFETTEGADFTTDIDLNHSKRFAKRYYTKLISLHFANIADVTNPNFVRDAEVWFKHKTQPNQEWSIYSKFTIKVNIGRITKSPELLLSYEGDTRVLNKPILEVDADSTLFKWVIHNGIRHQYETLDATIKADIDNIYPVLNNPLRSALELETSFKRVQNKYKNYYDHIKHFFDNYINTEEFKRVIPLRDEDFISVKEIRVKHTSKGSNSLTFGKKNGVEGVGINPYNGILNNGPHLPSPFSHINIFFICHEADTDTANKLYTYFKEGLGKEPYKFPSLAALLKTPLNISKNDQIKFSDINNPIPEIRSQLSQKTFDSNKRCIAIYVTPITKDEKDPEKREYYYRVKEELLKYGITSQVVETETINDSGFKFSLPNIAIAILAKLQGIPWRLDRSTYNELVVGVGAFKPVNSKHRYIGSAFCFSNNGLFQGFECYTDNDTYKLAGSISKAVKMYANNHSEVKRLVIHFYKQMSREEYEPIEQELNNLGLDIPIVIITINKTESSDIVVFDRNYDGLIPISGTYINVGYNQFLLNNNTRYTGTTADKIDSYSFPVKLSIRSNDKTIREDAKTINNLVDQVYQFSRMYWKSVKQQNLPVTIKYPEMVAEIFPHFEGEVIPSFGKDNLWFL